MNKITKIFLSIIAGMNVVINIITPIILVILYLALFGIKGHWTTYAFLVIGWGASLFRAIKIGGWINP